MPPTMRVIDLTHTITPDIPVYPGTEPPTFEPASTYERDGFRETLVTMYTHTGTHIDPPYHLYPGRTRLDEFPADRFVGMALRIDCRGIPEGDPITIDRLRPYGDLVRQADFLLFNTGWDSKWGTSEYFGDYPCIDDDVLDLIIGLPGSLVVEEPRDLAALDDMLGDKLLRILRLYLHIE